MDARRLHFLKAMDVDVWVRRDQPDLPAATAAPVASVAEVAPITVMPLVSPAAATIPTSAPSLVTATHDDNVAGMASVASMDWDELFKAVRGCTRCPLHASRTQGVFGVGNRQAEWMIVGEAPGADEDRQGEPFVGRAGQLLNSMLQAMGFPREQVFIANVLKSRPPGNRDPKPEEVAACIPYLARQIELVNPRIILCVGRIAAQNLLNTETPIGKLRGQVHRLGTRPVVVTYHPAYLLRSPGEKRKAWDDLQLALRTYEATPVKSA
ncbi:MAG: uracil-DNA glycosylase [Steroidobacteraceae bacterium]